MDIGEDQVEECVQAYQADRAQESLAGMFAVTQHLAHQWAYHSSDLAELVVRYVGTVFEEGESRRRWLWGLKEYDWRRHILRQCRREYVRLYIEEQRRLRLRQG